MKRLSVTAVLLAVLSTAPAQALTVSVGTGAGCDHATLHDAFVAIRTLPGEHHIHIRNETYATPNGTGYVPAVAQTGVYLEGGYTECADAAPNGDPGAPVPVFNAAGGAPTHALDLRLDGLVGTFQLRRMGAHCSQHGDDQQGRVLHQRALRWTWPDGPLTCTSAEPCRMRTSPRISQLPRARDAPLSPRPRAGEGRVRGRSPAAPVL